MAALPAWLATNYAIGIPYPLMLCSKLLNSAFFKFSSPDAPANKGPTACVKLANFPLPSLLPNQSLHFPLPPPNPLSNRRFSSTPSYHYGPPTPQALDAAIRCAANFSYDDPIPTHPQAAAFVQLPDPTMRFGEVRRPTTEPPSPPPSDIQTWLQSGAIRLHSLFACLSVCLFVCLPVCLVACLSVCLFVCLFVCLPCFSPSCFAMLEKRKQKEGPLGTEPRASGSTPSTEKCLTRLLGIDLASLWSLDELRVGW